MDSPIEPYVIVFDRGDDAFKRAFPDTFYCAQSLLLDRWFQIRAFAVEQELSAIVFVSSPVGMAFASTMGVAPRHIWWSHKWHGLELPHLDGYIDATMGNVGPPWIDTFSAYPELYDAAATPKAVIERAAFKYRTVFGTMCREEKITAEYCAVIRSVLDANPDSCFVYTGRKPVAGIDCIPRTRFIGWIDPAVWAQVIDVYLDTFPFGSGHTAWQAIAAGKPVVSVDPDQGREQGFINDLMKAAGQPYIAAADARQYVEFATGFADGRLADWIGHYRRFYRDVLRDEKRMAQSVSSAILSVISSPPAAG